MATHSSILAWGIPWTHQESGLSDFHFHFPIEKANTEQRAQGEYESQKLQSRKIYEM